MRSTPSLDRGRFVLPRDLSAATATAAALIVAILVLGWLAGGLVSGVWSPRAQVSDAAGAAIQLATPSDRDREPRPAAHASVPERRAAVPAARPVATRAQVVSRGRSPRRARAHRNSPTVTSPAVTSPAVTSPAAPAPVATPVATPAPTVVAAAPAATATANSVASTGTRTATSQPTVTTSSSSPSSHENDDDRGRTWRRRGEDHGRRSWRPVSTRARGTATAQAVPTPTPTPAPAVEDDSHESRGWDHDDDESRNWDHDRDDHDRHNGRGRSWNR